jgi:Baseplate J-like protein
VQRETLEKHTQTSLIRIDDQGSQEQETDAVPQTGEIQDVYVLIVREQEEEAEDASFVVASTPVPSQKASLAPAYAVCGLYLVCILATLAFQLYCIGNPEIATVTIVPKTQLMTLSGTVQLGRLLPPLTISQSQNTKATGRGHQDARAAVGTVTLYNGQQTSHTIAQGTVFTDRAGVSIETTQQAIIPAGNPGTGYGTVTVTAQALQAGSAGNIPAGDVSTPIALAVFVRNNQFTGGQDERTYTTVTQEDIHSLSTVLKTTLARVSTGALQGQVHPPEQLFIPPCTPTVTSDHRIGDEATHVKVTVSQTCSAIAYNSQTLAGKATTLLTARAEQTTGAGYRLFGTVAVLVKQATVTSTPPPLVFLLFQAQGSLVYALGNAEQLHIKSLIAGKITDQAEQLLLSLPGIERASLSFSGIGDATRIPKNSEHIHLSLFIAYPAAKPVERP